MKSWRIAPMNLAIFHSDFHVYQSQRVGWWCDSFAAICSTQQNSDDHQKNQNSSWSSGKLAIARKFHARCRNQAGKSRCWWSVLPKISPALSLLWSRWGKPGGDQLDAGRWNDQSGDRIQSPLAVPVRIVSTRCLPGDSKMIMVPSGHFSRSTNYHFEAVCKLTIESTEMW